MPSMTHPHLGRHASLGLVTIFQCSARGAHTARGAVFCDTQPRLLHLCEV